MASWKDDVRAATTGNLATFPPSGSQTIDGVVLSTANADRVLVKNQTTGSQNGIWVVNTGAWTRSTDANTSALMTPESSVRVSEGGANAHTEWFLATQAPITLGTTALTFARGLPSSWKDYVRAATTANLSTFPPSGSQTIDTVVLNVGDRVLVKNQTTASQNGIWLVNTGAWTRAVDASGSATVTPEMTVRVSEGTTNAHSQWTLLTPAPITLGTTALTYGSTTSLPLVFVTGLGTLAPLATRQVVVADGYSSVADGGEGVFAWQTGSFTTDGGTVFVPTGYTGVGAWVRQRENKYTYNAAWFGAPTGNNLVSASPVLQRILDLNGELYLPKTANTITNYTALFDITQTWYFIDQPLYVNDYFPSSGFPFNLLGNTSSVVVGDGKYQVGIAPTTVGGSYGNPSYLGPRIICGNMASPTAVYVEDSNNGQNVWTMYSGTTSPTLTGTVVSCTTTSLVGSGTSFTTQLFPNQILTFSGAGVGTALVESIQDNTHATLYTVLGTLPSAGATMTAQVYGAFINYSQYETGQLLIGTTPTNQFCFEFFWNPLNDAPVTNGGSYQLAGSYGVLSYNSIITTTFQVARSNFGGGEQITATLTTTNGTYSVNTAAGHGLPANFLSHIAVTYDGANFRLFINGAQPDSTMTTGATGNLGQKWYEQLLVGHSMFGSWPIGGPLFYPGAQYRLGTSRLTLGIPRYTAPFTPSQSSVSTCDSNTKLVVDFSPANRPARGTMGDWIIGHCGMALNGVNAPNNLPVWLRTYNTGETYTSDIRSSGFQLQGAGYGIYLSASLQSHIGDLSFLGPGMNKGLTYDNFSYNATITGNCDFNYMTGGNYESWNIGLVQGAQNSFVGPNIQSAVSNSNFHLVSCDGTVDVQTCFQAACSQGTFYLVNCAAATFTGVNIDDENGTQQLGCFVINGCDSVTINGGTFFCANTATPTFLIFTGGIVDKFIANGCFSYFAQNIFAFKGTNPANKGQNLGIPLMWNGFGYSEGSPQSIVDPSNPGPVIIPQNEAFGIHVVDVSALTPGGGGYALSWNQFLGFVIDGGGVGGGSLNITDTVPTLTGNSTIFLPTVLSGYRRFVTNSTAYSLTVNGPTGTGPTIATGKSAYVQTNGTNVIRLTPDT